MPEEATQLLAQFAAALTYDQLPDQIKEHCKNLLLDTLACALAGHQGEETEQVAALASALAQSSESSVIGGGRLSLAGATLLNGYLITAVTMCDAHRSTMTHVTPEVIPPALAIAERDAGSGRDLLVAIAAGAEVTTRIGIGLDYPAFRARGFHGPGVLGPFGAAAAVGRLRGFDAETMAKAFGLAGSQAAGTFAAWGTPTVKFHQCRGALSGLLAALLAEQKFLATREFLTAQDGGLYNSYSNGGKPELATDDLGRRWELEQIALRLWPSASLMQGMATALFDLLKQHTIEPVDGQAIARDAGTDRFRYARQAPEIQRQIRCAHLRPLRRGGDCARPRADACPIRAGALRRSQASPLRRGAGRDPARPGAGRRASVVEIEMGGGATLQARCEHARGSFENPLSRAEVEDKFRVYAKDRMAAARIDEVIAAVNRLEDLASVRELMDMLRHGSSRTRGERAA